MFPHHLFEDDPLGGVSTSMIRLYEDGLGALHGKCGPHGRNQQRKLILQYVGGRKGLAACFG